MKQFTIVSDTQSGAMLPTKAYIRIDQVMCVVQHMTMHQVAGYDKEVCVTGLQMINGMQVLVIGKYDYIVGLIK